jgi:hypothetical protein
MISSRFVLSAALASIAALVAAPGCSSEDPVSRVAIYSELGDSAAHPHGECQLAKAPWLVVGAVGNGKSTSLDATTPINDGDQGVHITACSVVAEGNGFRVNVSVRLDGSNGGALAVDGHLNSDRSQSSVRAVFSRSDTGAFSQSNCTATFTRDGENAPEMGVAGGRVWANVNCPDAELTTQGTRVCGANAEFRFENCSE